VQLLWALFDLVRHGGAHQYQQITAELQDGTYFGVSATGVVLGEVPSYTLERAKGDRAKHLGYITKFEEREDITTVLLQPEIFFLDVREAVERSNLLARGLSFRHLTRPREAGARPQHVPLRPAPTPYQFTRDEVRRALYAGGHVQVGVMPPSRSTRAAFHATHPRPETR
jgi:hypothetical protein